MTNILYSATRQWNPGDEFILRGAQSLFDAFLGTHNALLYNRHPDVLQPYSDINPARRWGKHFRGKTLLNSFFRIGWADNSFKSGMTGAGIDVVVVAGSPGWYGKNLAPLYRLVATERIPVVFLGIGSHDATPEALRGKLARLGFDDVLRSSRLVTVRDRVCERALSEFGAIPLPCPALLSAGHARSVDRVRRIALIYSTDRSVPNHKVTTAGFGRMVAAYGAIIAAYGKQCEIDFVAHYVDEFADFHERRLFPGHALRYSYDSADYARIYEGYDLVIGPRVHGIGIAASLGIPGIHLGHDHRSDTVAGFLAENCDLTSLDESALLGRIATVIGSVADRSGALQDWKQKTRDRYLSLMQSRLDFLGG